MIIPYVNKLTFYQDIMFIPVKYSFISVRTKLPLCLSAVAVLLKKKKLKMSNDLHILSDKTNFNSNESILQKRPLESDFHVHARTSIIRVNFLKPFSLIL